jgi:hypothetical protein
VSGESLTITGWRLAGIACASTSSRMSSKGKFTLWQETLNSTAAIWPTGAFRFTVSTSSPNSSAEKPPSETIRFRWWVRGKYSSK